jgi:U3 small nucleolar RNA-associated protein 22
LRVKPEHDPLFLNNSGYFYPILVSVVGSLIEKCLGKRAQLIDSEIPPETTWQVSNPAPQLSKHPFRIGLVVDREAANKAVEKCESEDPIQAQMFKDFWGERSQLRRFKDGTMCETVIFVDKTRVCFQMLSHILSNHLGIQLNSNGADYLDFQVERLLDKDYHMLQKLEKPKKPVYIKGKRKRLSSNDFQQEIPVRLDEIANKATGVFDEVSKILRSLTGLPLEITTVQGASSILRFTNVCPTPPQKFFSSNLLTDVHPNGSSLKFKKMAIDELPPKVPKVVEPISVVLHLETSGKWPDNVKAIDRLKCAFLIRIGQLLKDQFGLTVQPHSRYLDVCKVRASYFIKSVGF